ncbi:MAG: signal peptidase II [Firmicutes bacterium]|nr:signal peptidase II [Bacillota bacterium]
MFLAVFLGAFGIDLATKLLVSSQMRLGQEIVLVRGLLSLNYVVNYGAAYNLFENNSWLLIPVTAAMMLVMLWYYRRHRSEFSRAEICSFAMILGGGAGNLLSRLYPGYVVDFIDIHILPVFNAADIFICCGCALLLYCEFFLSAPKKDEEL